MLASTSYDEESKLSNVSSLSIDKDLLMIDTTEPKFVAPPVLEGNCYLKTKTGAFK